MYNPLKYFKNRKVGLALGSGGARGLAHIAVLEYLESMEIPIDMIAGSSIGAVVGGVYACGSLPRFKAELLALGRKKMFSMLDPVFPRAGLLEGVKFIEFLSKFIPRDIKIEDLPFPLAVTATDLMSGRSIVFRSGNLLDSIRASVSIPGVLIPVKYRPTFLVDGGVANPLPINVLKMMGAGLRIAVNLHPDVMEKRWNSYVAHGTGNSEIVLDSREISFQQQKIPVVETINTASWLRSLEKRIGFGREIPSAVPPSIFEVILQSIDIMEYVNTRLLLKSGSPHVLIEPRLNNTGTLDFTDASKIILEGLRASAEQRPHLKRKIKAWI
jgi:NTE family protein